MQDMSVNISTLMKDFQRRDIRLACFDVDTCLHSSGSPVKVSFAQLSTKLEHVAKGMAADGILFMQACLAAGIRVALTSFDDNRENDVVLEENVLVLVGEPLIRPALAMRLDRSVVDQIAMYFLNPTLRNGAELDPLRHYPNGRSWHVQQAMERFGIARREQVVLVDGSVSSSYVYHTIEYFQNGTWLSHNKRSPIK